MKRQMVKLDELAIKTESGEETINVILDELVQETRVD